MLLTVRDRVKCDERAQHYLYLCTEGVEPKPEVGVVWQEMGGPSLYQACPGLVLVQTMFRPG